MYHRASLSFGGSVLEEWQDSSDYFFPLLLIIANSGMSYYSEPRLELSQH